MASVRWASFLWAYSLLSGAHAKMLTQILRVGGPQTDNHWKYVSKFGYTHGLGTYGVRMKLNQPRTLKKKSNASICCLPR